MNTEMQDLNTDIVDMTAESLNFWLTKFIEVCKDQMMESGTFNFVGK